MRVKIPPAHVVHEAVVPFHDCDPLAVVWHGHYYKYLEIARTALLQRAGLDVPDFIELGYRLLMLESRCRHAFPLRLGERFRVSAWFIDYEQRLHLGYQVQNLSEDRQAALAWTTLVTTDREGEMLFETPAALRGRIQRFVELTRA